MIRGGYLLLFVLLLALSGCQKIKRWCDSYTGTVVEPIWYQPVSGSVAALPEGHSLVLLHNELQPIGDPPSTYWAPNMMFERIYGDGLKIISYHSERGKPDPFDGDLLAFVVEAGTYRLNSTQDAHLTVFWEDDPRQNLVFTAEAGEAVYAGNILYVMDFNRDTFVIRPRDGFAEAQAFYRERFANLGIPLRRDLAHYEMISGLPPKPVLDRLSRVGTLWDPDGCEKRAPS